MFEVTPTLGSFFRLRYAGDAYKRAGRTNPVRVVEESISGMRSAMESGRITSHEFVVQYLVRIGMYEDHLHAVMRVNPHALAEAGDRERAAGDAAERGGNAHAHETRFCDSEVSMPNWVVRAANCDRDHSSKRCC